tara:strand:+ start:1016 stop:1225 length:210 start_codon:yes stop_codon:yes gene_type:complete
MPKSKRNFTTNDIIIFLLSVPELVKLEENKWMKEYGVYEGALKYIENSSKKAPDPKTLPVPPQKWLDFK